jgi:hypothetical protein
VYQYGLEQRDDKTAVQLCFVLGTRNSSVFVVVHLLHCNVTRIEHLLICFDGSYATHAMMFELLHTACSMIRVCMHAESRSTRTGYDAVTMGMTFIAQHVFINCIACFSNCQMHFTSLIPMHSTARPTGCTSAGAALTARAHVTFALFETVGFFRAN